MPETRAFRAVIFDFGGVFTTSPVENFAAYEKARALPDRFIGGVIKAGRNGGAFARYERGEIAIEDFDALFAAETRAAGHEITGRALVSMLGVRLRPEMALALDRVKSAGFKTGCITNTMPADRGTSPFDARRTGEVARIFASFDHVIESAKAGVRKPEPRIYTMMCEALAVGPRECVFLDDLGVNLKPARDMGMATIKVQLEDVRPAIGELAALLGIAL